MRWSRHHTDTSLGELLDSRPDDPESLHPASTTPEPEDDTHVRPRTSDGAEDPADSATEVADPDGSFLDDEDYLPQERRGPGRLTVALVAALVLAVGVLGGVWVEKQLGSTTSAAAGQRPGAATGGQGFPGGSTGGQGFPGGSNGGPGEPGGSTGQAAPGGTASGTSGTEAGAAGGSAAPSGGSAGTTTPVVVGTVSSTGGKTLVVTDLGGTKHTVAVTSTTTVTAPYGHGSLATGDTVAITGSTATDGSVTATGVTVS